MLSRQAEILHGLCGIATATIVMRQVTVVLVEVGLVEHFYRLRCFLMESFTLFLEYRSIGHFLRQCMLEDVFNLWKRGLFVEKFFVLEGGQQAVEVGFGLGDDLAHEAQGKLAANNSSCCSKAFSSGARRSIRAARMPWTVVGM